MAKFGEWTPYGASTSLVTPPAKSSRCPVLCVSDLTAMQRQGLPVFWHPDGPIEWVNDDAKDEPMLIEDMQPAQIASGCVTVSVVRCNGGVISTTQGGNQIRKSMRSVTPAGYHHREQTPVFTNLHPSKNGGGAKKVKPAPRQKPDKREQGKGIQPPYGTVGEQENEERWGPLYKHDPAKHCKKCGLKGGCKCPRGKQIK